MTVAHVWKFQSITVNLLADRLCTKISVLDKSELQRSKIILTIFRNLFIMLVNSISFTTKILIYAILYLLVSVFDVEACSSGPG